MMRKMPRAREDRQGRRATVWLAWFTWTFRSVGWSRFINVTSKHMFAALQMRVQCLCLQTTLMPFIFLHLRNCGCVSFKIAPCYVKCQLPFFGFFVVNKMAPHWNSEFPRHFRIYIYIGWYVNTFRWLYLNQMKLLPPATHLQEESVKFYWEMQSVTFTLWKNLQRVVPDFLTDYKKDKKRNEMKPRDQNILQILIIVLQYVNFIFILIQTYTFENYRLLKIPSKLIVLPY